MKKVLSYLLAILLAATPFSTAVPAFASAQEESNRMVLEAEAARFNTGDTIKVSIKALKVSDLYGLQFTLCYDTSLLEKESIAFNKTPVRLVQWASYEEPQGSMERINYALTQSVTDKENVFTGELDEAVVGEITFVAKGEGSTGISLENTKSMGSGMDSKLKPSANFTLTVQIGNTPTAPKATAIEVNGADKLAVPAAGSISSAYTAIVKDQFGHTMTGEKATWSLLQSVSGVSINRDTGVITVGSTASAASFIVKATLVSNGTVIGVKNILLDKPGNIPVPTGTSGGGGNGITTSGDGISSIDVSLEEILAQLQKSRQNGSGDGTVTVELPPVWDCSEYVVRLPAKAFAPASGQYVFRLVTPLGTVQLSSSMFAASQLTGAAWVGISLSAAGVSDSKAVQAAVEERPVIRLQATVDGKKVQWQNPAAPVKVSIPYTLSDKEAGDYRHIVIWELDDAGSGLPVPNGKYCPDTKSVTFSTTRFNRFGIGMAYKTFEDVSEYTGEARAAMEVLAAKGAIAGITEKMYKPEAAITRADFLFYLVNTLGLTASFQSNFADVKEKDYYYQALGVAKALGIAGGTGKNLFKPEGVISRQDMAKLTVLAMKAAGITGLEASEAELGRFTDAASIASYARESMAVLVKMGILKGGSGAINPRGSFNRREAALVLYRLNDLT